MKSIIIVALLSFALPSLTYAQIKNDYRDEKIERELIELVRKWDEAMVKRDTATLGLLLADEFTLSGMPKSEYLASVKLSTAVTASAHSSDFDVRVYKQKEMAVLIAVDKITSQGNKESRSYRYIDVWIKRDGRWQCVVTESHQISN